MKKVKYLLYGILTFILGLTIVAIIAGTISNPGGPQVTTGIFNSGIMALTTSVLFLSATITICTALIINTITKDHK